MLCLSITSLNPSSQLPGWGMRIVPGGQSYITPNGASEFGLIYFPDDGSEGIYTRKPFPGSSTSHPSPPLSLFRQSATIPLTELQEQPRTAEILASAWRYDGPSNIHPYYSFLPGSRLIDGTMNDIHGDAQVCCFPETRIPLLTADS